MTNNWNDCVTEEPLKQQTMCSTLSETPLNGIRKYKLPLFDEPDNTQRKTPDLFQESERLKTFEKWDNSSVTPYELAKVGLYYCPQIDKVKCAYCDAEISPNFFGESPLDDHLSKSPYCPFARSRRGRRTISNILRDFPQSRDVCGNVDPLVDTMRLLSKMMHPYEDYNSRLRTFENWPTSSKQKPEKLAEAGFYYRGEGDKTVCFRCSGPLTGWNDDDDPWEQHALWFPKCKFLQQEKGEGFIDEVQKKLKPRIPDWKVCEDGPGASQSDKNLCVVCCTSQDKVVLVPCGHDSTCLNCVGALEEKKCPICRAQIVNVWKL